MHSRTMINRVYIDKRKGEDRRADDLGPPAGWNERRNSVERRLPTVEEESLSEIEWFRHLVCFVTKRRSDENAIRRHDRHAP
jgi:hypothetical protein